jgi:hypothetical protein
LRACLQTHPAIDTRAQPAIAGAAQLAPGDTRATGFCRREGRVLRAAGTRCLTGTEPGSLPRQIRTTPVVNADHLCPNGWIRDGGCDHSCPNG